MNLSGIKPKPGFYESWRTHLEKEEEIMSDVKVWDDVRGIVFPESDYPVKSQTNDPVKLKSPTRTLEDMLEQNDNMLDGIINNLPEETVAEKEAKTSIKEKLKSMTSAQIDESRRIRSLCPERELC